MPEPSRTRAYRDLAAPFQPDNGELLACLHAFQHHYGYVPPDAVPEIARRLRMTPAAVFGTISYYSEFRSTPPPETLINWCSGPACRMKGGEDIRRAIEAVLCLDMEQTTADNRVGLHLAQCEGSCVYSPLVWLRSYGQQPHNPDAVLVEERGEVVGPLRVSDAIMLARRLNAGDDAP